MIRNIVGSVLALAGATAAVWSPFRAWYDGRHGRDYRIEDLFTGTGITDVKAEVIGSLFLPMAFAALLTLIGIVLRSRVVVAVAGVVVLGFTILWMARVGQAENGLNVHSDGRGLGSGVALALGGGVLLLVGAFVMSGRPRPHATRVDRLPPPTHPTSDGRPPEQAPPSGDAPAPSSSDGPRAPGRDPGREPGWDEGREPGRDPGSDPGQGQGQGRDPGQGQDPGRDDGMPPPEHRA